MKERIVSDGRRRAYEGSIERVRSEVAHEFREAFEKAPFRKRIILILQMKLEVRRRMRRMAPPDGLYLRS